jgi:hypothetical protein
MSLARVKKREYEWLTFAVTAHIAISRGASFDTHISLRVSKKIEENVL